MRITQYTDYGLRVLIYLGLHREEITPMPAIANHYGISSNHLMKVTQQLTKLGYVESTRGRTGGLRLAKDPTDINIGQVVREMEPMEIVDCFSAEGRCVIEPSCHLKGILGRALRAFLKELEQHTLAELVENKDELTLLFSSSPSSVHS
ncbi:Rrf2 family transcriptional regulator [Exiguobacterium sp. KRL4]|uniref:Rrf2 family transcriptional regulator n=1 Tax=Exiguobacterium sp. KRL4 TaxID=1914536 RepID=UPI0008F8526C|nr:Rrf2 family transcriptional regulator [Exiguobacterium sp. KRL4]OIN68055.1 Rrf2 family transcriptional regulator [Exiguobacterium sp. KRL4]